MSLAISDIQEHVSAHFKLPRSAMISQDRKFDVAHPRQVAMYLARKLTKRSTTEIGMRFGGRDHTTVIHAEWNVRHNDELLRAAEACQASIKIPMLSWQQRFRVEKDAAESIGQFLIDLGTTRC